MIHIFKKKTLLKKQMESNSGLTVKFLLTCNIKNKIIIVTVNHWLAHIKKSGIFLYH